MTGDGILNNNGNPNNMGNTTKGDIKVYVRDEEWRSYYNDLLSGNHRRKSLVDKGLEFVIRLKKGIYKGYVDILSKSSYIGIEREALKKRYQIAN